MNYTILTEAIHPETGELYKLGDTVTIYQGRFGHNNIITINSIFTDERSEYIYVSDKKYTIDDYQQEWPNNPKGTYLNSVKKKLHKKEHNRIIKAIQLAKNYQ